MAVRRQITNCRACRLPCRRLISNIRPLFLIVLQVQLLLILFATFLPNIDFFLDGSIEFTQRIAEGDRQSIVAAVDDDR